MCVCVLYAQSCPILCDPTDCSPWGSVRGIFPARILEWVAIVIDKYSSHLTYWGILFVSEGSTEMVTVDSCYATNKIKVKKLVVSTLICCLTLQATWGLLQSLRV